MGQVVIELLSTSHDRKGFDCGRDAQNSFLKERARKQAEIKYSTTWVAVESNNPTILGFVTLSMGSVTFENISEDLRAKLPKYPMPVLHVGQLATDVRYQGKGIGPMLLAFAAEQAVKASKSVGCFAIELQADNEAARLFYLKHGFIELKAESSRLYQSISTLEKAMSVRKDR